MIFLISCLMGVACAAAVAVVVRRLPAFFRLLRSGRPREREGSVQLSWVDRILHARRINRFREGLPAALSAISTSVRAGLSLPQAMQVVSARSLGPVSREFGYVVAEAKMGSTLDRALAGMERRTPLPEVKLLVAALKLVRTTGGNLAPLLDRLVDTVREREHLRGQFRTLTAQARLSGWVVGLTPVALVGFMTLIDPEFVRPLMTTNAGLFLLGLALVLEIMGVLAMRAIVRIEP